MRPRSLLFVPGDRPERFAKAVASGADAIILDLEDSVAPARKSSARQAVAKYLAQARGSAWRFIRMLVLPKAEGSASIAALQRSVGDAFPPILPIATETPAAIFELGSYRASKGLAGLTWGAEDLPAAIGAITAREADGRYTPPYDTVRSLTLFAAHAAGVPAIETVYPAIADSAGLAAYAERGSRDGFTGMMAIHPSQVRVINRAFSPSAGAIAFARSVIAAFEAEPDAGVLQLGGRMIDAPHLRQARLLFKRAEMERRFHSTAT